MDGIQLSQLASRGQSVSIQKPNEVGIEVMSESVGGDLQSYRWCLYILEALTNDNMTVGGKWG